MPRKAKVERNKVIIHLIDDEHKSWREVAGVFGLDVRTIWDAYHRHKGTLKIRPRKKKTLGLSTGEDLTGVGV